MNDQPLDTTVGVAEPSQRRRRRSGPQWQQLIAEQAAGEVTAEAFCKHHGLALSTFHAWRRRFKQRAAQSEASGFVELRVRDGASCAGSQGHDDCMEVRLGSATLLAPLSSVREVVAALLSEAQRQC